MSFSSGVKRKMMPPEVGSRTISLIAGFFRKTVDLSFSKADSLYSSVGIASGIFRVRLAVGSFAGVLVFDDGVRLFFGGVA